MKIVFATNNAHKLDEIRHILGEKFEVLSLNDINCHDDIPETGTTLEENARQKAEYIYNKYHMNVFADDTGLEVEALGGEPGVYSARYAAIKNPTAESHDSEANMTTLLKNLEGTENRNARFRTVIALILTPHNNSHSSLLTPHSSHLTPHSSLFTPHLNDRRQFRHTRRTAFQPCGEGL